MRVVPPASLAAALALALFAIAPVARAQHHDGVSSAVAASSDDTATATSPRPPESIPNVANAPPSPSSTPDVAIATPSPSPGSTPDAARATPAPSSTPDAAIAAAPSPSPSPTFDSAAVVPLAAPVDARLFSPGAPPPQGGSLLVGASAIVPEPRERLTRSRAAAMIAQPAGCVAFGAATFTGLANQLGDAGTPALEMGSGYAGAWAATTLIGLSVFTIDHDAFKPSAVRRFSDAPWIAGSSAVLVPLAAGAATFGAGERLEGGSRHPWEAFGGAVGGAAAVELLSTGASMLLRTPGGLNVEMLAFVPVASGSAIGYRLGHGHDGRAKPLLHAPFVVVSARF